MRDLQVDPILCEPDPVKMSRIDLSLIAIPVFQNERSAVRFEALDKDPGLGGDDVDMLIFLGFNEDSTDMPSVGAGISCIKGCVQARNLMKVTALE